MKVYLGTKIVSAEPREKDGAPGYAVIYGDGYQSWSPKDVFEAAYVEIPEAADDHMAAVRRVVQQFHEILHIMGGTQPSGGDRMGSAHLMLALRHLEDAETRCERHVATRKGG